MEERGEVDVKGSVRGSVCVKAIANGDGDGDGGCGRCGERAILSVGVRCGSVCVVVVGGRGVRAAAA